MQSQAISTSKLLVAFKAFKGLVSSVDLLHVPDQSRVPDEELGTDTAGLVIEGYFLLQISNFTGIWVKIRQIWPNIISPFIMDVIIVCCFSYGADTG